MTSQKDQIQRLIAEIEATLAKPASRLSLGWSGEADRQRQLLNKLFNYLQSLQQVFESPGGWGPLDPDTGQLASSSQPVADVEESASQVLQGLLLEMRYLRENSLKPMRQELELLQQKRDSLQAEINGLEAQRGADPLQSEEQINAFLEILMQRLQEQLSAQMAQNFAAMEAGAVEQLSATDHPQPLLSGQRLEQVRLLQAQSDQLLLKLDTTLTAVFDSLQKSVDSYRESLEEGLDQMHGLGRQGEVIFHAFINHLAQQLGQDASAYLVGELGTQLTTLQGPEAGTTDVELDAVQLDELDQALENLSLEEEMGEENDAESDLEIDPDLALLQDEISSIDDEDITVIQTDGIELAVDSVDSVDSTETGLDIQQQLDSDPEFESGESSISLDQAAQTDVLDQDASDQDASDQIDEAIATSLDLGLALEDIDENLGLLAIGADDGDLLSFGETTSSAGQDGLPQPDVEGDLFSFDADFDLGLSPAEPDGEPVDAFEQTVLPTESAGAGQLLSGQLSNDLLTFSFADEQHTETSRLATDEPLTETEQLDASQVANEWLFEQASLDTGGSLGDEPLLVVESGVAPSEVSEIPLAETTVQNLFGDSIATPQTELSDQGPDKDTVDSLSELLPDSPPAGGVEDSPDDVYVAAPADENLINLVESVPEQRLLIDFDDGQLVEQLDEDLQKLAGDDTFSVDHDIDEENVLDPLDQDTTLETIVQDLNLEDLDLGDALEPISTGLKASSSVGQMDEVQGETIEDGPPMGDDGSDGAELDLFEGFAVDSVDIDDPSANEDVELSSFSSASWVDIDSQDLDVLGEVTDSLLDEFDDGLPDSLANELGDLSAHSQSLSQASTDNVGDQLLSDLEEPVVGEDDVLSVPTIEDMEPHLDSASMPDLPSEFSLDDLSTDSPEADDFLQAEQAAFWQTMAEDEGVQSAQATQIGERLADVDDDEMSSEVALDLGASAVDLDDLVILDDLPLPEDEAGDDDGIDLGDLDDLFGQSPLPDLEAVLDQGIDADTDISQSIDPLAELGLDATTSTPEVQQRVAPEVDLPLPEEPMISETSLDVLLVNPSEANVSAGIDSVEDLGDTTTLPPGAVPPETTPSVALEGHWFLGLDVGSTGLSAVLMNRRTGQVYPLYWQMGAEETKHFRLPAAAIMTATQDTVAVGYDALGDLGDLLDTLDAPTPDLIGVNRLKPFLKVAVGHGKTLPTSDPWLRWSDTVELPMLQVLQAMVALLKYLVDRGQAVGLDGRELMEVWDRLQGVIVGYPTNWPDTYSFNLREALLAAGLIDQPGQILFVEDAIATILSGLPDPSDVSMAETVSLSRQPSLYNCQWQEGTVVISGGATMTELGLVNLPKDLASLDYADFSLRSFAYAGDALDQDIICQLLLPEEQRQPLSAATTDIVWDWQGHLSAEDADWHQLNLNNLTLPAVGHVDWAQRYRLQQRLLGSSLGQSLLAAARHLKLALQQKSQIKITLAGQHWLIKRRHLENLIFLPYIQRINRYLNVLLSHHTVDAQAIKQVICTGGSASLPAIARWLRQKFPNATIIQDTYASELPQSCSRVAYGLVNVARYAQVVNVTRQQYSDYFLLMELLRVFPQQPLPVGAIMHLLEQRGINTQACHLHILALLEGHLPPGLVPTAADRGLICDRTADLPTYRALLQTPLFSKTVTESGGQIYIPNESQAEQLRAYFNRLLVDKVQTLEEPLIAELEVLT